MDHNKQAIKTGTTTLGIVCKEGIVIAADKKVTMGNIISQKSFDKVEILNDYMALTIAGLVSDAQLLTRLIKAQVRLEELRRGKKIQVKEGANLLANLVYNNVRRMAMGYTGFLFAGIDKEGHYLYEVGVDGSLVKFDNFTSDGSGMVFALGVLESQYKPNMSIDEGIELAQKAIHAAIQRDTASGGGIDVVTITKEGTKRVMTKMLIEKL